MKSSIILSVNPIKSLAYQACFELHATSRRFPEEAPNFKVMLPSLCQKFARLFLRITKEKSFMTL